MSEIIRQVSMEKCNDQHDGGFSILRGTKHYQVTRCSRDKNGSMDEGTFNHSPMLAYINKKFYLSYINNPISETVPPSRTLLKTSKDGEQWSSTIELFPPYRVTYKKFCIYANMHHRMGFFISSNRKLYGLGFYGISRTSDEFPNNGKGIGRVIREIMPDGQLGEIYFIRYNRHAGWGEENTSFPHYLCSNDSVFIQDCEELLGNKLLTLKWWEEDRSKDGFYSIEDGKGFTYYHLSEKETIGLWKWGNASISFDRGLTWSPMTKQSSLVTAGGKIWAEKIKEGKYALVYNPTTDNTHRWPLVVTTSEDGKHFEDVYCLTGWVSPRKYFGFHKYYGPSYPSGLTSGSDVPPGNYTWIVFSMNKEDIWISKINLMGEQYSNSVNVIDEEWGIIKPKWGSIEIINEPDTIIKATNQDPYEALLLQRWTREATKGGVNFDLYINKDNQKKVLLELVDKKNQALISLFYSPNGILSIENKLKPGDVLTAEYNVEEWETYSIHWNVSKMTVSIEIGEKKWAFLIDDRLIEGLVFKTQYPSIEVTKDSSLNDSDLLNADYLVNPTSFMIRNFNDSE